MTFYPPDTPMIPNGPQLTLLFRVGRGEETEVLHTFRASFAGATAVEAPDQNTFALHIRPGICSCGGGAP